MKHPRDELAPYLLGELSDAEVEALERHLAFCDACRGELHALGEGLTVLVDGLSAEAPPEGAWQAIAARVRGDAHAGDGPAVDAAAAPPKDALREEPGESRAAPAAPQPAAAPGRDVAAARRAPRAAPWTTWALAAILVLAAGALWWGWTGRSALRAVEQEQTVVARWLARDDVVVRSLPMRDGGPLGSVLVLPDGRALLVLAAEPPEDRVYQAWGIGGDRTVSLGVVQDRVTEYRVDPFERFWLSLEPPGGSEQPTDILGATGLG